ncbi:uncharacterized protein LOC111154223 [Enhydra lutris kenyoni]|uniref:Uncharacterized protein LOC111154223 n=1 Tax=Enhydra lutris kenyoni TaxID=391180 RepID=A0A2Y9KJC8_ENHLU|nr:uncharacterized protein LOC111154223 [Enhydra lutris kenyoni]
MRVPPFGPGVDRGRAGRGHLAAAVPDGGPGGRGHSRSLLSADGRHERAGGPRSLWVPPLAVRTAGVGRAGSGHPLVPTDSTSGERECCGPPRPWAEPGSRPSVCPADVTRWDSRQESKKGAVRPGPGDGEKHRAAKHGPCDLRHRSPVPVALGTLRHRLSFTHLCRTSDRRPADPRRKVVPQRALGVSNLPPSQRPSHKPGLTCPAGGADTCDLRLFAHTQLAAAAYGPRSVAGALRSLCTSGTSSPAEPSQRPTVSFSLQMPGCATPGDHVTLLGLEWQRLSPQLSWF